MIEIKPLEDDFFVRVIEQKSLHKPTNKALADFLKVLANSGSYGLFVQVNPETLKNLRILRYFLELSGKTIPSLIHRKGRSLVFSSFSGSHYFWWALVTRHARTLRENRSGQLPLL